MTRLSSSGMSAHNASPVKPWILDSKASSYMTGIKQKFVSLNFSNKFPLVNIADGIQSPILGNGVVQVTSSLTLTDVFLNFLLACYLLVSLPNTITAK